MKFEEMMKESARFGEMVAELDKEEILGNATPTTLTARELSLLRYCISNSNQGFSVPLE